MKRIALVAAITVVACSRADSSMQDAVQQAGSAEATAAVQRFIDSTNRAIEAAFVARDIPRIGSVYTEQAMVMPPNEPIVQGRAAIEKWNASDPDRITAAKLTTIDLTVSGDYAIEVGKTDFTTVAAKGGKVTNRVGKYLTIWQKQADGSWKITRDMFSPDK